MEVSEEYFTDLEKQVKDQYEIARAARKLGYDPVSDVETPIAMSLAEKAVGLISTVYPQLLGSGIVERILALEQQYGQLDMAVPFKIAEEIARSTFCAFDDQFQAIDAGVRVGFSYITLGVVSSPIEGFTEIKLQKTRDGKEYFVAYFSGPIRSAGTTASCMVLMLIDYLRETFGYAKYDPTEDEVKRYVTENYDYHERVNNLQYLPTEEEITFLAQNIPIQISGEPTEQREVSNYKDLSRIETNFIRGGMCLIFSEGLAQKAQKGLRLWRGIQAKGFTMTGWEFLDAYITLHKKREKGTTDTSPTYIKDLVAGRPVFSHPSRSGGFRFRYGRHRMSGFSATSVHPGTMGISDSFLSVGTQLKIERPTKGCVISACDDIDGPIVRLKNGSVKRVRTLEEAHELYPNVAEILYFGDLLVSFGDVANRNYELLKPGYVEEWWILELEKAAREKPDIPFVRPDPRAISFVDAISYSRTYGVPLHPDSIFFWKEISLEQFVSLLEWLSRSKIVDERLVLPYAVADRELFAQGKRALELLGVEHDLGIEHVLIHGDVMRSLLCNLGVDASKNVGMDLRSTFDALLQKVSGQPVLELVNLFSSPVIIKDKSGTFIGARMGRPEKAKARVLTGSPHVLFSVGDEGGRLRSLQAALDVGSVTGDFPLYHCDVCNHDTIYSKCESCGGSCVRFQCSLRGEAFYRDASEIPPGEQVRDFKRRKIDVRHYFEQAKKHAGLRGEDIPMIKGVRGTSNKDHSCEHLIKGILRAKHDIHVNKDGTVRYDMTEMAITHFRPSEVGTSIEKLQTLGYTQDVYGSPLIHEDQLLLLFPHDIILPACPASADEGADAVFFRTSKFIDDELEKLYKLDKFFKAEKKADLIGHLFVCIAPHICTATVGRLIGFSKTQTLLATPFMHAAMRRDCDGDEAAVILLMDLLLNFSRKFLPAHRGGTQDAPLVLNVRIKAGDVDDQILDLELGPYPLELYELAEQGKHSSEVKGVDSVKKRLKEGKDPFSSIPTHGCFTINNAVTNSSYKSLPTMHEKVEKMMQLCEKIRAVDVADVARLIIERHFIRDTRGNLRKFSMQVFRCIGCNEKFRRPPLSGKCTACGGRLIFTISEGSILKYMGPALNIARQYQVSDYLLENLELNEMYIQSIFGKEKEKQEGLQKWF